MSKPAAQQVTPASSGGNDPSRRKLFGSPVKTRAANIIAAVTCAAAWAATLHPQSVLLVVDSLYTRVPATIRFNTLLPATHSCTTAPQLSVVMTGATTTIMSAPKEAIRVLQDWEHWLKDSDLPVASRQQITDAVDDIA